MIDRAKIREEVLFELGAGISPNRQLVRAIELTMDKVLAFFERPDGSL